MDITWKINSIKCKTFENGNANVVSEINWFASATDGKFYKCVNGSVAIPFSGTKFTAYENLTEEQVLNWAFSEIDKDEIEANLASHINSLKNPTVVTNPLPWVKPVQQLDEQPQVEEIPNGS